MQLKCIKKEDGKYINSDELNNIHDIAYIYIPVRNEIELSSDFPDYPNAEIIDDESVFLNGKRTDLADTIKEVFNPLLSKQNLLFITGEKKIAFEVPQTYFKALESEEKIQLLLDAGGKLTESLLLYSITKDLRFMNELTHYNFDPSAFRLCESFLKESGNEEIKNKLLAATERAEFNNDVISKHKRDNESRKNKIPKILEHSKSQKNVVFIHLESISNMIFNQNKRLMPALTELLDKSVVFPRYYSSATSTIMSVSAIFHGNDFETDRFAGYEDVLLDNCYTKNIFRILRENGYETKPFIYTNTALTPEMFEAKIYDDGDPPTDRRFSDYNDFLSAIDSFFESNKDGRFSAFIDYEVTHCGVDDSLTAKIPIFEQKSQFAYIMLNETIEHVWKRLEKDGLLEKTIIILYGDHGDDKWTRCINNGFSHMTEPYLSSINTPLAIYDSRLPSLIMDGIVSGVDIKPTVLSMLGIQVQDEFPYGGINVFKDKNDCVFSASLFANQQVTEKINSFDMAKLNGFSTVEKKNKSFCIIDESYCLLAGKDGLQMFNTVSDPLSYNNLLNFYELDECGYAVKFNNHGAWRGHFRHEIMADSQLYDCLKSFYKLKGLLKERIEAKNSYIENMENPFDFSCFEKVRDRGFIF